MKQTELPKSTSLEEKEDYLWCTGASHCPHTDKSLHGLWLAAGKMSGGNSLYIYASFSLVLLRGHYDSKCYYYSMSSFPSPSCMGSGLWRGMSSFKPGWLCGSNLDNAL